MNSGFDENRLSEAGGGSAFSAADSPLEGLSQEQARRRILELVEDYADRFHQPKKTFQPGERIPYAARVYDSREMVRLVDAALDFWLTAGRYTDAFEKGMADFLGVRYCALVNSGSSADLLAFMALTSPLLGDRAVKRGDEVITVAAGFPTTVAPIIQYGAVPVFVDVTIPQYNIDVSLLEGALSPRTKAVMIAHTLGNPFDLQSVKDFCVRHGLWLIEDNCDALGSRCLVDGEERLTGTVGDLGASSFYPPHHMTMGEGGAVYTNDPLLSRCVRSLRDWGRDCMCPPGTDNLCGHRFDGQFGQLPRGYDHKYVYSHFGYNLKATDLQAAVGCAQLEKLPGFIQKRRENFQHLFELLSAGGAERYYIMPQALPGSTPSWFGFLLTCREDAPAPGGAGDTTARERVVRFLEGKGIQTRMLFAGNLLCHPCFDPLRQEEGSYRVAGSLTNTDRIMRDSFWVGVYPGMTEEMIAYMAEQILAAARQEMPCR